MRTAVEDPSTTPAYARAGQALPLKERLLQKTGPIRTARRGPIYNHPPKWYCKPDGDVVLLPGDPQNRAYYEDKGYYCLREHEVDEWLAKMRPEVIKEQRRRASIVTALRRIAAKNPTVEVLADVEIMTTEELEDLLKQVGEAVGAPVKVIQGRIREEPVEAEEAAGTSLGSGDELEAKIARSSERKERRAVPRYG